MRQTTYLNSLNYLCEALPTYPDEFVSTMPFIGYPNQGQLYQIPQNTFPSFSMNEFVSSQPSIECINDFMQYYCMWSIFPSANTYVTETVEAAYPKSDIIK